MVITVADAGEEEGPLQYEELEWDDAGVVRVKDSDPVQAAGAKPAQYVPLDIQMEEKESEQKDTVRFG